MTRTMLLLVLISSAVTYGKAQDKNQGKIEYEVIQNLHAALKPDQQQFKEMIPETVTDNAEIYFNGTKAKLVAKKKDHSSEEDGVKLKVQSDQDNVLATYMDVNKTYKLTDLGGGKKELQLQTHDFKGKALGKAGSRTRNILGFTCREVIMDGPGSKMVLWIADDLPFTGGPMGIPSDKGAILGIESKVLKITATAINYVPVPVAEVSIPAGVEVKEKKEK